MIWTIARREILGFYATPVAWLLIAAAQAILAWLLFKQLEVYQQIQPQLTAAGSTLGINDLVIAPTYSTAALMLLVITPLLGMRSFADEMSSGRIRLLLSSSASAIDLVLGKWLGLVITLLPLIVLMLLMALALSLGSSVDIGKLITSTGALLLLLGMSAAVSVLTSTLTSQPAIAAVLAYALLLLLWIIESPDGQSGFNMIAILPHIQPLFQGSLILSSLTYFLSLTLAALTLGSHRIWQYGGGQ